MRRATTVGEWSMRNTGIIVLLATSLAACESAQISRMGPDKLAAVSDGALCNTFVQATPAVNVERQRRNLGDCSVAHRQCVQSGFQPGTFNYLQCRQIAANAEAAERAAYVGMMQAGATMMASQPPPPPPAPPQPTSLLCTPNPTFGGMQAPSMTCR
jgi:hypothetical protein